MPKQDGSFKKDGSLLKKFLCHSILRGLFSKNIFSNINGFNNCSDDNFMLLSVKGLTSERITVPEPPQHQASVKLIEAIRNGNELQVEDFFKKHRLGSTPFFNSGFNRAVLYASLESEARNNEKRIGMGTELVNQCLNGFDERQIEGIAKDIVTTWPLKKSSFERLCLFGENGRVLKQVVAHQMFLWLKEAIQSAVGINQKNDSFETQFTERFLFFKESSTSNERKMKELFTMKFEALPCKQVYALECILRNIKNDAIILFSLEHTPSGVMYEKKILHEAILLNASLGVIDAIITKAGFEVLYTRKMLPTEEYHRSITPLELAGIKGRQNVIQLLKHKEKQYDLELHKIEKNDFFSRPSLKKESNDFFDDIPNLIQRLTEVDLDD